MAGSGRSRGRACLSTLLLFHCPKQLPSVGVGQKRPVMSRGRMEDRAVHVPLLFTPSLVPWLSGQAFLVCGPETGEGGRTLSSMSPVEENSLLVGKGERCVVSSAVLLGIPACQCRIAYLNKILNSLKFFFRYPYIN